MRRIEVMCRAPRMFLGAAIFFVVLLTGNAMAVVQTVQVVPAGGTPCANNAQYPTIQQAVNSVTPNSTILVCPGIYPEQVVITKNLTLRGVNTGSASGAVIVPPVGGIVANTTSLASATVIGAQVLVQSSTKVNISNLAIDGSNNGITGCAPDLIGIVYQNASGIINEVSVSNEALSASLNGCQSGDGVFVQSGTLNSHTGTSTVKITNSIVQNYQKNGITGNEAGTDVTVSGNSVIGQGPTTGAAENGIQIGFGAVGTVTSNTVTDDVWIGSGTFATGILVYASANVKVSSNNVSNTQGGIVLESDPTFGSADGSTISLNRISTTHIYDGIDVCSDGNTISRNIVSSSDESAIHLDDECTEPDTTTTGNNNDVFDNTVNTACAGILEGPVVTGNFTGGTPINTFFNVTSISLTGSDTCTPAFAQVKKVGNNKAGARHGHGKIQAAR